MRKLIVVVVAAVLALAAPRVHAQSFTFGLTGGLSVPLGDFSDSFGLGSQGGVFGDYWINNQFALGADIAGSFHTAGGALKDSLEAYNFDAKDVRFAITQFAGHAKWKIPAGTSTSPWLMAGAGLYNGRTTIEIGSLDVSESESKFGFAVGGGLDFAINESFSLGGHVMLHTVPDAIQEFDANTGDPVGDSKSAQYITFGVTATFGTSGTR